MAAEISGWWWFDVTTLFRHRGRRLSGIPRVLVELLAEARTSEHAARIRLVRFDSDFATFRPVEWEEYDALLSRSASTPSLIDRIKRRPPEWLRARTRLIKKCAGFVRRQFRGRINARNGAEATPSPFSDGDIWVSLGLWWQPRLLAAVEAIRESGTTLTTVVMMHDCIPLVYPELCTRETLEDWAEGIKHLEAVTDIVIIYSNNTKSDVGRFVPRLRNKTRKVSLGDSFVVPNGGDHNDSNSEFGIDKPYVLIVGTLEPRKNHILALRAWQSLLQRISQVPDLVFAGSWGWNVKDLRGLIKETDSLGGRLKIVEAPSDAQLVELYRGAMFTLYPSLYEGWGLPVRESLHFGKICVAANNSALVESGDGLAVYFDSNDLDSLVDALATLIQDSGVLARAEQRILDQFHEISWAYTWSQLSSHIVMIDEDDASVTSVVNRQTQ